MIAEMAAPHCTAAVKFSWPDCSGIAPLWPEVVKVLAESGGFGAVDIAYPQLGGDA